ncbi:hypothetical protein I532_04110 [Brevibacillus borstelensis AK1]|uniref:Uncharacterized protein n=1 Tax=Brevibacillus borstelensis AK1 TaxID=1300222 RepID=M8EH13_9BACL|nr:hypothetical protein [Brevibacillus borstelensis]EMT54760.1 hypothetical protein I532_04110 [Brevibacillus borstelensis AK1]
METVMHEGKAYKKVERHAKEGDKFVLYTGGSALLTGGKIYEIKRFDYAGDPQIIDDDGDEYDLCTSAYYSVLEPVESSGTITVLSVTPPTEKTYTLVVSDSFLAKAAEALAKAGNDALSELITEIRQQ